jgi:DNA repair protein RecN (Recombination protein N)
MRWDKMLLQLDIHNMALIDNVSLRLGDGLNILSGETGAGKSVIIDSLHAIKGERLSKEIIRTGSDKAVIEAVFNIDSDKISDIFSEQGIEIEEDGTLIASREFSVSGKNICRINGKIVTLAVLNAIGERLVDIHGQYDSQSLLKTENHIMLLDAFGGAKIQSLKKDYINIHSEYKSLTSKIKELSASTAEREKRIDMIKFQIDDIKSAELIQGEEEALLKTKNYLVNSEKIKSALSECHEVLFDGEEGINSAYDDINIAIEKISSIAKIDEKFAKIASSIEEIHYMLEDVVSVVRTERDNIEFDQNKLEKIDERMDLIFKLKRKYGDNISEVLKYLEGIENELDLLNESEENISELTAKLKDTEDRLEAASLELHDERISAAGILESKIGAELNDLEMKKSLFKVDVEFSDGKEDGKKKYFQNGSDKIEFLISPNAGEPLKPLSKIASGGEMSRIMLAIKTILANVDSIPSLLFDEIDIGISGRTAQKVGEKLSYISKSHQVICVTHLAQIACMADINYLIEKSVGNNVTTTNVKMIKDDALRDEIARILGGASVSDITLKHAKEMLETARKLKETMNQ